MNARKTPAGGTPGIHYSVVSLRDEVERLKAPCIIVDPAPGARVVLLYSHETRTIDICCRCGCGQVATTLYLDGSAPEVLDCDA